MPPTLKKLQIHHLILYSYFFLINVALHCLPQDDGQPMQAVRAVQVLDEVGDYDVETLLGFPLLTKAEPYTARAQVIGQPMLYKARKQKLIFTSKSVGK